MTATWDDDTNELHLHNGRISYLARVLEDGSLGHLYFGPALTPGRSYDHLLRRPFHGFTNRLGEPVAREYPTGGAGDFRVPALVVEPADGSPVLHLAYAGHRILSGKPAIPGLPSTYAERDEEAETVEVRLADAPSGVEARLIYTIFRDMPAIARSAVIRNGGREPVRVRCAMSGSLDLPDADWELLHLSGTWSRERHLVVRPLAPGRVSVSSVRGASSHEHNPFVILRRPATTEEHGEAYGFSLVYSGNFRAEAEVDAFATTRVRIGIEPDGFAWTLAAGEELAVPEVVLVYAADGLGELSAAYHRLYRERLARGAWRDRPRPVLINNWEATYFDFTEDVLVEMAAAARELGVELFVLDDGWFGERDDDTSSLGDWTVDRRKLPGGLEALARRVLDLGLQFGLWIEPEMVSPRSHLFAQHPEWAVGVPGRPRTESRDQLVLDMSRPEVVDHLFAVLSAILASAPISYVKWDMNRNLTEPYSAALAPDDQGEFFHRHILGVYDLYDRLTRAFPEILFESCASGGGRFDAGLLAFAPQAWTSDDTDAVERLAIQWGTSLGYPLSAMAAHVSAVPNHQVGRITPLATRAAVAFFGVLGYELDPRALTAAERAAIVDQVAFYKEHRDVLQRGRFHRLRSPFEGDRNTTAWMAVAQDARRAVVGWYRVLNRADPGPERIRLRGLDPALRYRVRAWPATGDRIEQVNARVRGGDDLMQVGLFIEIDRREAAALGDFPARIFTLEAVEDGEPSDPAASPRR
ncbi:MAG TPA: alpha-galactosidase [Candidatus Nanopelagicales bacterium]|nr:alpha-galactosidase [Candidatus Nanopelagicales bacterium]